jgi:hypothetical protein
LKGTGDSKIRRDCGIPHLDLKPLEKNFSRIRGVHAGQNIEKRRLSRTIWAHETKYFSGVHRQIHPGQNLEASK